MLPNEVIDGLRLCQTALRAVTSEANTPEQQQVAAEAIRTAENLLALYEPEPNSPQPDEYELVMHHLQQASLLLSQKLGRSTQELQAQEARLQGLDERLAAVDAAVAERETQIGVLDAHIADQIAQIAANDAILAEQRLQL